MYEYDPRRTAIILSDPYGLRLETRYTVKRIEGSNPSFSAIFNHENTPKRNIWGSFFLGELAEKGTFGVHIFRKLLSDLR